MSNRSIACTLLVLLAGCAVQRVGEFGDACTNGKDDDGDHLIDCNDPDCLGVEACRPEGGMVKMMPRADAGAVAPDAGHPAFDAGAAPDSSHAMEAGLDSGGALSQLDASGIDEDGSLPSCNPPCPAAEACVADATSVSCQPVAARQGGSYRLRITSAIVPNQGLGGCYGCTGFICTGSCTVDPYVRVVLVSGSAESEITRTSAVMDTVMPMFSEAAVPITLMTGDVLRFEAWQDKRSPEMGDRPIFDCKPDLTQINGSISCTSWVVFPAGMITAELQ
jgi:hypothetical protein